jgi:hypothetical protein
VCELKYAIFISALKYAKDNHKKASNNKAAYAKKWHSPKRPHLNFCPSPLNQNLLFSLSPKH